MVNGALVAILGQNPGELEEQGRRIVSYEGPGRYVTEPAEPQPFIGPTGWAMEHQLMPHAGLERDTVSYCNAIRCRWQGSNKLPPTKILMEAVQHCQQYLKLPESTMLVVATGELATFASTGVGLKPASHKLEEEANMSFNSWRGYLLPFTLPPKFYSPTDIYMPSGRSVLVTYHIAYLPEAPWLRPVAVRDWQKIGRILAGTWPRPLPMILPLAPVRQWPLVSAFDTEFLGDFMTRYSLAYLKTDGYGVPHTYLHVVERENIASPPEVLPGTVVIMQNAEADLKHLNAVLAGATVSVEDTMYAHAVLWSDLPHDLNFGGSLYSSLNRWKHLAQANPRVYSGGDAVGTLEWWLAMAGEFSRDSRSKLVYERCLKPQLWVIADARQRGIKVNHARIGPAFQELEQAMKVEQLRAQAAVGWPLNIDSPPQVARQLYDIEKIK